MIVLKKIQIFYRVYDLREKFCILNEGIMQRENIIQLVRRWDFLKKSYVK